MSRRRARLGEESIHQDLRRIMTAVANSQGAVGSHNLLSASHGDAATTAVSRGDLMAAAGDAEWDALNIGADGTLLESDGTDPSWVAPSSAPGATAKVLKTTAAGLLTLLKLVLNQGANDDELLAGESSDVAHGCTDEADTDAFVTVSKADADAGGAHIRGMRDADGSNYQALRLQGTLAENVETTKGTANRGIVTVEGYESSGTSLTDTVADGLVFSVLTRRGGSIVAVLHVDEDGDLAYDGTAGAYDSENDVALLREISDLLARPRDKIHSTARSRSEALGIVTVDKGGAMVSQKRHTAVVRGAVLQLEERIRELEAEVKRLKRGRRHNDHD